MRRSSRCVHPDDHPRDGIGRRCGRRRRSARRRDRLGGLGAYESISVRGAAPGHTAVLIDGVPLARIAAVTTDLGRFALDVVRRGRSLSRRGAGRARRRGRRRRAQPRDAARARRARRARVGRRSAPARSARGTCALHYGDSITAARAVVDDDRLPGRDRRLHVLLRQRHAAQSRPTTAIDVRKNNGFDRSSTPRSRVGHADRGAPAACALAWKQQGLPGTIAQPALAGRRSRRSMSIGDGAWRRATSARRSRASSATCSSSGSTLRDPTGELGLGAQDRALPDAVGRRDRRRGARRSAAHRATAGVELRGDRFRDRDDAADAARAGRRSRGRRGARRDRSRARSGEHDRRHAGGAARRRAHRADADDARARRAGRCRRVGHRAEPAAHRARAR